MNFIFADSEGMSDRVEQFQKSWFTYKLILPVQFSLGQFYVANQHLMVKLFLGQTVGKMTTFAN